MRELQEGIGDIEPFEREPGEECGVFGICAPGLPQADIAYQGMLNLQHRGEDAAGMAVSDGIGIDVFGGPGQIEDAFNNSNMCIGMSEGAKLVIGHNRYATVDANGGGWQPVPIWNERNEVFATAHNGHIQDLSELADEYSVDIKGAPTDTYALAYIIDSVRDLERNNGSLVNALSEVLPKIDGAYSMLLSTPDQMLAVRDPHGFRPLHLGRIAGEGWVVASEKPGLVRVGANAIREIEAGEILQIDGPGEDQITSHHFAEPNLALCSFEFPYFSRPDNVFGGISVAKTRMRAGELLAENDNVDVDMVMGVPESGNLLAIAYANARGLPYNPAIIRNRYVGGRSFTANTQALRSLTVLRKLNVLQEEVEGKRLLVTDDSIVRGTTARGLVKMLREAGALEVHLRVGSPAYKYPCHYGMDTGRQHELIASYMSEEEISDYIGTDSLRFITPERFVASIVAFGVGETALKASDLCTECTTGIVPVEFSRRKRPTPIELARVG